MEHIVTPEEDGMRLSSLLRQVMKVSYSAMKSAKWDNRILVSGQPRTVDQPVYAGEAVAFRLPDNHPLYRPAAYDLPLTVPYEDEHLLIIDKPAPLPSLSSAKQSDMTLENAVFSYLGCQDSFIYRPVNRLDKGTSGLMIVAKNAHAQQLLQRMLHTDAFARRYLAVVEGTPAPFSGVIDAPIAKEDAASIRRVITPDGKPSVTHYEVLDACHDRSIVRLQLMTGRTHQIRVHMAHIGHPVCGDFLYGWELPELPGRFALHSCEIDLVHPFTGEQLHIESPLPEALQALMCHSGGQHG